MKLKFIIKGMRPKTLSAAIVPPVCAFALYYKENAEADIFYMWLCVGLALCIQIATNFYNDAIDFLKGADDERVGPDRLSTQDKVNYKAVFFIGHFFILLAFLLGIPLVIKGGVVLICLGLLSMFLAYGYTGGPFPLAYLGLGELFVFVFFGLVATCGSYYIYSGSVSLNSILLGSQIGLLSSVLIGINNYRDRKIDKKVNKNTLATRMSRENYLKLLEFFLFFPYVIVLYFTVFVDLKFFFPLFAIPLAHKIRYELHENTNPVLLNQVLGMSGKHLLLFGVMFCTAALCA